MWIILHGFVWIVNYWTFKRLIHLFYPRAQVLRKLFLENKDWSLQPISKLNDYTTVNFTVTKTLYKLEKITVISIV